MGVRGLQTFLEKFSPDACSWVDISNLTSDYKARTGKNAKIVIDAQSCYQTWYGKLDWLVGYEVREFIIRLRTFVESFKELDVELVFFFGGLNPKKKRKTWLERRRRTVADVDRAIHSLKTSGRLPNGFQSILPNQGFVTAYILKYVLGCEVHMTIDECDEEIIRYARENECFAIFGQDTDFVISQVNAIVLSSKNFTVGRMTTRLYDREKLARRLGIRTEELPLLAILAGNDLIPFDELREFHRRICPGQGSWIPFQNLMPAIACYINKLPKNEPIERTLTRLAVDLFGHSSLMQLLKTSYNSYFVEKTRPVGSTPTDEWSKILHIATERYRNAMLPILLYSVLSEQILESGSSFEDLRINHNGQALARHQPSSTVLRPLRRRLYGILFSGRGGKNHSGSVTIQEWCGENMNSYSKPVSVRPIKPEVHHPGLLALWSDDKAINKVRWTLFLSSISSKLKTSLWQSFDGGLLFSTLSVYYLYETKYLNDSELDAILITIATYSRSHQKLSALRSGELDFRAVNISTVLNRTFELVLTLLAACGYPVPLSENNAYLKFEGKLFHKKYTDVVNRKEDLKSLCENNDDCLTVFKTMKKLIIRTEGEF